ncbi:MAG: PilZ domain-containing protein [Sphingomicrobium sp.]
MPRGNPFANERAVERIAGTTEEPAGDHDADQGGDRQPTEKVELHRLIKRCFTTSRYRLGMDESSITQNRRSRRSKVLLSASIEFSGASLLVNLRDLSSEGALIEADKLPVEGSEVVFRKAELSQRGRIAWVEGKRAGLAFLEPLPRDAVLRHIPTPRARVQADFRRPGLHTQPLSADDVRFAHLWVSRSPTIID